MGRRSQYPEEFRQRAAQLVLDSHRSIRDVAAELGINHETLRNWVNAAKREQASGSRPAGLLACPAMSVWSWPDCGARLQSWSWSGRS
jgi:transposase